MTVQCRVSVHPRQLVSPKGHSLQSPPDSADAEYVPLSQCPIFCTRESWFKSPELYIRRQSPAEHVLLSTKQLAYPDGETVVAFYGLAIHLRHFHFSPAHQTIVRDGLERMHKGTNASCRLLKVFSMIPQSPVYPKLCPNL